MSDGREKHGNFLAPSPGSSRIAALVIVVAAIATSAGLLFAFRGVDADFHLMCWFDVAKQWRDGILVPRWSGMANYGFGEATFVFYAPLSFFVGAALVSILPAKIVPAVYCMLVLTVAGLSMLRFAREWLPERNAQMAAVGYVVNPYHLVLIYWIGSYAQLLAVALFPLLLLYAIALLSEPRTAAPRLAIILALIWYSETPAAIIASYVVAIIVLYGAVKKRDCRTLSCGCLALVGGVALSAAFWLPGYWQRSALTLASAGVEQIHPATFLFSSFGSNDFYFLLLMSFLAVSVFVISSASLLFASSPGRRSDVVRSVLLVLTILGTAIQLPFIAPLWRRFPYLLYLQSGWRWVLLVSLVAAFAVEFAGRRTLRLMYWVVCAGLVFATYKYCVWQPVGKIQDFAEQFKSIGGMGTEVFVPSDVHVPRLPISAPLAELRTDARPTQSHDWNAGQVHAFERSRQTEAVPSNLKVAKWNAKHLQIRVNSDKSSLLFLRLAKFPSWHAYVDGDEVPVQVTSVGQVYLPVSQGSHFVELSFREPPMTYAAVLLSVMCAGLIAMTSFRGPGKGRKRPHGRHPHLVP